MLGHVVDFWKRLKFQREIYDMADFIRRGALTWVSLLVYILLFFVGFIAGLMSIVFFVFGNTEAALDFVGASVMSFAMGWVSNKADDGIREYNSVLLVETGKGEQDEPAGFRSARIQT